MANYLPVPYNRPPRASGFLPVPYRSRQAGGAGGQFSPPTRGMGELLPAVREREPNFPVPAHLDGATKNAFGGQLVPSQASQMLPVPAQSQTITPTPLGGGKDECCETLADLFRDLIGHVQAIEGKMDGLGVGGGGTSTLPEEKEKSKSSLMKRIFGIGDQLASTQTAGGAIGQLGGGISAIGGALPGPLGAATGGVGKFVEVMGESVGKVQQWTNTIHASNMQFAMFSASMSRVQAMQEVREIQLSRQHGEARAGTAEDLAKAKNRLDRTTAPIEDLFANGKNWLGAQLADLTADLLEPLAEIAKVISGWFSDSKKVPHLPFEQALKDISERHKRQYPETYGRPRRFNDNGGGGDF